jgi:5-methylcytosine-specific restriction endonuclease McrA
VFEDVRSAVDTLKTVARDLDPLLVDGAGAAALFEVVSEGERVGAAMKALLARRIDETKMWARAVIATRRTGLPRPLERRSVRPLAHWTQRVPGAAAGYRCRLPRRQTLRDQAAEIASAAVDDPGSEVYLLETAGSTSVKGLRDRCRDVWAGAEADDRARARRLHAQRRAHDWMDPDGAYCMSARLAPVEVHVTVDSAALARGHTDAGERCDVKDVGPVPVTTARALLDNSRVSVLVRADDDITAVSSPKRTIPTKLRRALEASYPSCGVTACANNQFLEIDHVVPLEDGGRTELANAWRICSHHDVLKTYGGWRVVGVPRNWDLVPPDDPDPP